MRDLLAPSYGLEEEVFICDAVSGAPVTPIPECRQMLKLRLGARFALEYKACVGELITGIHHDPYSLVEEAAANRFEARSILKRYEYELVALATHPQAIALETPARDDERYHWIEGQKGDAVKKLLVNGVHLHVGTYENDIERMQALPVLLPLAPIHAAAASCSPYFDGHYTGQADWRLRVLMQLAPALPFSPQTLEERDKIVAALAAAGGPRDASEHWGLLRMGAVGKPTIEFRAADTCPSLDHVVWLAALSGAAAHAQRIGYLKAPQSVNAAGILLANLDRIAGAGARALLIDPFDFTAKTASEYAKGCIDRCAPSISALNLGDAISRMPAVFEDHASALHCTIENANGRALARGLSTQDAHAASVRFGVSWAVEQAQTTPSMSWTTPRRVA